MSSLTPAEREVLDFHRSLQEWLSGSVERTPSTLEKISRQMALSFGYFMPDGQTMWRDTLVSQLEVAWGAKGSGYHIRIENMRLVVQTAVLAVVVYEEWQHVDADPPRGRLCTAVLAMHNGNRNNIEWLHVHESWMAAQ